ncbi:MAG: alpha-amylase family glycosyl hydrolase [Naasia sp.]
MTSLLPHHDGSPLHVSTLTPSLGETVLVRLRVPDGYGPLASVRTRMSRDNEPEWAVAERVGRSDGWDWWEARVGVHNLRTGYRWLLRHEDGRVEWLNQSGLHDIEVLDQEDFALLAHPAPPAWLSRSVMYQIFPDRFARSSIADERAAPEWAIPVAWDEPVDPVMPARSGQFYGGDLDGIVDHLDHLERLGVDLLYLTPFFPAESNHRYDAASFTRVDPLLGGEEALIRLVEAAHARGMRVIGDLTTNHSGDRHEWFQGALRTPGSPSESFYYFTDADNAEYISWLGTATLPKFDWTSETLRRRFITDADSVVRRWLSPPFALDGWRLDVWNMTGRMGDEDCNAEIRSLLRRTMHETAPEAILLAEVANDVTSDLQGDGPDGAMTYPAFTRPLWAWLSEQTGASYLDGEGRTHREPWFFGQPIGGIPRYTARQFAEAVTRFTATIPWRVRLGNMQALDTHDTARFADNAAAGTIPVAVGLSVTLPGLPVVFMGDEFGLLGADGELSRTPLPWGTEGDAGTAERIALYQHLIGLRRAHPALADGGLRWLHVDEAGVAFVRESAEESVLVIACREDLSVELPAGSVHGAESATALVGSASLRPGADGSLRIHAVGPAFAAWALPGVAVLSRVADAAEDAPEVALSAV